jgi:hypothetical protein
MNAKPLAFCLSACAALSLLGVSRACVAQSTIKRPGDRPPYHFEAEPHLLLGPFDAPGWAGGDGFGIGFRGTVEIAPRGFIPSINNSVGIGFGLDWVHYAAGYAGGVCTRRVVGPNGTLVCTEVDNGDHGQNYFYLPVVMQWNFWLAKRWSVFGEPGILPYFQGHQLRFSALPLTLYAGGRFHFNDRITLTMRIGYPTFSLGASFLL